LATGSFFSPRAKTGRVAQKKKKGKKNPKKHSAMAVEKKTIWNKGWCRYIHFSVDYYRLLQTSRPQTESN
jgi:hypothetical protein